MARRTKRKSKRRQRGGDPVSVDGGGGEAEVDAVPDEHGDTTTPTQLGGAKRKKGRKSKRKSRKSKRKTKKKSRKKRKLNKFFVLMLAAKKKKLASFKYNGKTYKGKKHNRLGMIYRKA